LNNTPEVYPAGEWFHYCNSTESENFTATEFFTNVPYIVNKAMPTLTLLLNGTDSDYTMERGSSISIEATLSIPGDLHLLVNGSEIATGPSPLTTSYSSIMPGQHNITAVFEGNENYTAVSAQHWLTVQDTTAPIITILSPANTTYNMMSLDLNWTASEPLSWAGYSLDGAPNVTLTGNTSLTPGAGTHTITIYGTDNAGLTGSDSVTFTMECVSHIFNSTIDNTYYNNVHMNLYLPDSTIYCSNVNDSTIINTTMTNSTILRSYVKGKNLIGMWIEDSWVDPTYGNSSGYSRISADSNVTDSSVWYSNVTDRSNVYDSGVNYSSVTHSNLVTTLTLNSTIKESSISYSTVKSSVVTGSTIPNATLTNTTVTNTQFCANIEAMDAVIIDNRMTSGYIIYKGITYSTPTNITAMCSLMNNNDTVPPVINRIWNTTAVYAGQPADFSINATDNVGIANITVNGTLATWIGGDVWTNTINVPGSDGIYRWLVTAMDYAGNTADRYISINVNTSNDPNVTIDLNPPIIGPIFPTSATLNKPLNLSANVSDDTEVTNCTLFINGNPVANMTDSLPSASATVKANWTFGAIGDYAVHAGCYDAFDNWAEGIDVMVSVKEAVITGGGGGAGGPIWTPSITVNVHSPIIIDIGTTGVFTTHVSVSGMTDATNVQLTVSGVPYTYSVTPQSATIKAGSSETFTIYMVVPDTAQPGTNHIKIIATSAQGLTGSGEADLIIKMPGQMIENVTNQTNATQPVTPTTPTTPSGLAGALLAASTNPLTAIGVMLAVIGLLGWLWYKKPELFRRKKTDGGEA
ncbi:MAG: hypothetical protein QW227_01800, partial [Candidatus Aenigmatarchaeota archaeon]